MILKSVNTPIDLNKGRFPMTSVELAEAIRIAYLLILQYTGEVSEHKRNSKVKEAMENTLISLLNTQAKRAELIW
jgi:hypothetical protein